MTFNLSSVNDLF